MTHYDRHQPHSMWYTTDAVTPINKNVAMYVYPTDEHNYWTHNHNFIMYRYFNILYFFRLFEVCQVLEREDQLMVLLVFEHLEQDLSDLIERLPKSGMPSVTIQVNTYLQKHTRKYVFRYCSLLNNILLITKYWTIALITWTIDRGGLFALTSNYSPWLKTTKLTHFFARTSENSRFRIGKNIWFWNETNIRSGDTLVSCPWSPVGPIVQ